MKTNLIIIAILLFSLTAIAQGPFFGAKYTKAYTKLRSQEVDTISPVMSFGDNYGIVAGYYLTESFGVQAELLFNSHKQKYEGDITGAYTSVTEIKTLDLPMLVTFGKVFYVEGGPVLSVLLSANFKSTLQSKSIKGSYDNYSWGGCLGGGANLHVTENIVINPGGRLYVGIKDYGSGVDALGTEIPNYKSTGWSLGAYVSVKIKI